MLHIFAHCRPVSILKVFCQISERDAVQAIRNWIVMVRSIFSNRKQGPACLYFIRPLKEKKMQFISLDVNTLQEGAQMKSDAD